MLTLQFKADVDNLTEFGFVDSPETPFFFTFKVECANCHEMHANEVAFNAHELKPLQSSRGEANFVMKCKFCGKDGNVTVAPQLSTYNVDIVKPNQLANMASFDCRGITLKEFIPRGEFWARFEDSGTKFTFEFDDNEWYDYDEKLGLEVSITSPEWIITKTK